MNRANERQHGGDHYSGEYQHWDLVIDTRMGYLEGCATKYLSRWRNKNGIEDLRKAQHYVEKLLECHDRVVRPVSITPDFREKVDICLQDFFKGKNIGLSEQGLIRQLALMSHNIGVLEYVISAIGCRIALAEEEQAGGPGAGYVDQG